MLQRCLSNCVCSCHGIDNELNTLESAHEKNDTIWLRTGKL